ncbi:MAG: FKBP-type peptidyl-prolyl cis-trans isomerase, partial [Bacteroidota bacterium]
MKRIIIPVLILMCIASCGKKGSHHTESGLEYIVHSSNEGRKAAKGDIVQLRFVYANNNDSVLFNSDALADSMIMEYTDLPFAQMTEAIGLLSEGDSATFVFPAGSVYEKVFNSQLPSSLSAKDILKWHVKLVKIYTREEFRTIIETKIKATAVGEDRSIADYCTANGINVTPMPSGLVYISFKEGKGSLPVNGDTLVVKYTARFLSGQVFDSSEDGTGTIRFIQGEGKMIKGWEEGFSYMKEGGMARFIIPSRIGYGIKGFGPVPPDTPVIYDVELLKILGKKGS